MIRSLLCASLLAAVPHLGVAQDAPFDPSPTAYCLSEAADQAVKRACIGRAAEACADAALGGFSTQRMTGCMRLEYAWFDNLLNTEYSKARGLAVAFDQQNRGLMAGEEIGTDLLNMQRAWIVYRDAACRFEQRQFTGDLLGDLSYIECMTRLTAEQVFLLQSSNLEVFP